jgi:hypothetical protein
LIFDRSQGHLSVHPREWASLLEQLGAPDARTLLQRTLFWLWLYAGTGTVLGSLVAIYELFGMAAFLIAVAGMILFSMWVIARTGGGASRPDVRPTPQPRARNLFSVIGYLQKPAGARLHVAGYGSTGTPRCTTA